MGSEEPRLTAEERAALVAIEAALADPPAATDTAEVAALAALAALVRRSAPTADPAYRLRLREHVRAEAARRRPPARPFTRRRLLVAGLAAATIGGTAVAVPPARAALGALLRLTAPPPTIVPPVVERTAPLPFALAGSHPGWQGPDDAQREYYLRTLVRERWANIARLGARPGPPPGGIVPLPGGRALPIPGYLPADFSWQGLILSSGGGASNPIPYDYVGSAGGGGGGGGSGMPWERPLQYDRQIAVYLIGGDPADRFLILQQLRPDPQRGVIVSAFQMDVPAQTPPYANAPPGFFGQRTALGLLVEPTRDEAGLTVQAGPNALHATTVRGAAAWWFGGQWDAGGQWVDDGHWRTLVWPRDGDIYSLAGEDLGLDELLRVAESLPSTP